MAEFEDLRARFIDADRGAAAARNEARTASIRAAGKDDQPPDAAGPGAAKERPPRAARLAR